MKTTLKTLILLAALTLTTGCSLPHTIYDGTEVTVINENTVQVAVPDAIGTIPFRKDVMRIYRINVDLTAHDAQHATSYVSAKLAEQGIRAHWSAEENIRAAILYRR